MFLANDKPDPSKTTIVGAVAAFLEHCERNNKPRTLADYRRLLNRDRVFELLLLDDLYFADPLGFNDPLDARPNLEPDLPVADLERVLTRLVVERTKAEMTTAAKSIRYTGPRTIDHIDQHSQASPARLIEDFRYNASDPYYEDLPDALQFLLANELEKELLKRYDRGIPCHLSVNVEPLRRSAPRNLRWVFRPQHRGRTPFPGDLRRQPQRQGERR